MANFLPIRILGTGSYVPEEVITNRDLTETLDTNNDWIVSRTGIRERRRAAPDEYTSTLAVNASRLALEDAGLTPDDIDLIICATASPDRPLPSAAAYIQTALGARTVGAFDVCAACAGFLYATSVASSMLVAGSCKRALVIGAETLTRITDPQDRGTAILFGDGAGAAILEKSDSPDCGILHSELGCDGERVECIWIPAGGSRLPTTESTVAERLQFMHMKGREVYKFAVLKMQELIDRALTETGLKAEDLKMVIPHQSNLRIIESVREKMNLPEDRVAVNIQRYGNTSSASVIMLLDECRRNGSIETGDYILLIALGAGLTWASMIVRL